MTQHDRLTNNVTDHEYTKQEITIRQILLAKFLQAMREDLAEWISSLSFQVTVESEKFLPSLENGIILCQHARLIQRYAEEYSVLNPDKKIQIPTKEVYYTEKGAYPGSFKARDNVANFIHWCRELGIPEVVIFESEDLVLHKNEKSVILTLMDVARKAYTFGVQPPEIVRFEKEIDEEIERDKVNEKMGRPPPKPRDLEEDNNLDTMVRNIVNRCTCYDAFPIKKLAEGKYQVGRSNTLIFVRVMRKHVMVRVGGGWDTFDSYITKHDPCRTKVAGNIERDGHTVTPSKQNHTTTTSTPRRKSLSKREHGRLQDSAYSTSSDTWSMCSGSSDGSGSHDSAKMECTTHSQKCQSKNSNRRHSSSTATDLSSNSSLHQQHESPISFNKSIQEIDQKLKQLENNKPTLDLTLKDPTVYDNRGDRWLRSHLNSIKQRHITDKDEGGEERSVDPMEEFTMRRGYTADVIKRDRNNNRTPLAERRSSTTNKTGHLQPQQIPRARSKTAPKNLSSSLDQGLNSGYNSLPRPRRRKSKGENKQPYYYDAPSMNSTPSPTKSCNDISTQTISTQTSPPSLRRDNVPRALRNRNTDSPANQSRIPRPNLQRSNTLDGSSVKKRNLRYGNGASSTNASYGLRREKSDLSGRMPMRREKSDLTGRRSKSRTPTGTSTPRKSDLHKNEKAVRVRRRRYVSSRN